LSSAGVFRRVFSGNQRFVTPAITFYFKTSPSINPACSVGFAVSSKHYNAVERNYLKRRMREAKRKSITQINTVLEKHGLCMDLVMTARGNLGCIRKITLADITGDVESFCHHIATNLNKQ